MRTAGIICEYNPLHNGHARQMQLVRQAGCDYIICVMSGNFVQRGEPALLPKWRRAKMALLCGADLVIELPVDAALAPAKDFAYGAAVILDGLGVVTDLCFGSETADIDFLQQWANALNDESAELKNSVRAGLDGGLSHPAALAQALHISLPDQTLHDFSAPNDVLAVSYLQALKKLNSRIQPLPVLRDVPHHQKTVEGAMASAGAIRRAIRHSGIQAAQSAMPPASFGVLQDTFSCGEGPVFLHDFDRMALARLRSMTTDELCRYPAVAEGLEQRILSAARSQSTIQAVVQGAKTRRYTYARIQRIVLRTMLGLDAAETLPYARVLGFRRSAQPLLSQIKANCRIPFFTRPAGQSGDVAAALARQARADDLYALALSGEASRAGQDFTHPIVIL